MVFLKDAAFISIFSTNPSLVVNFIMIQIEGETRRKYKEKSGKRIAEKA